MKILAITDIHKDYEAARSSGVIESPDLILDCGDHEEMVNLFNECPHFYIRGNHEPEEILYQRGDYPLPSYLPNGAIVKFSDKVNSVSFFGIDGNYGSKEMLLQVNPRILSCLKKLEQGIKNIAPYITSSIFVFCRCYRSSKLVCILTPRSGRCAPCTRGFPLESLPRHWSLAFSTITPPNQEVLQYTHEVGIGQ